MHPENTGFHIHIHEGASPEAVRAAVQEYNAGRAATSPLARVSSSNDGVDGLDDLVALGRRAYEESDGGMEDLLLHLARHPDTWVSYAEASKALQYDSTRSMPGLLGAFGRRAKHRYHGRWPIERELIDSEYHLLMTAEVADEVLRAFAEHQQYLRDLEDSQ